MNVEEIIPVEVVKPFKELRTPCPPAGTQGEIYRFDGKFACVRFPKPMVDTEGGVWEKSEDDSIPEYMLLKFLLDEISVID